MIFNDLRVSNKRKCDEFVAHLLLDSFIATNVTNLNQSEGTNHFQKQAQISFYFRDFS